MKQDSNLPEEFISELEEIVRTQEEKEEAEKEIRAQQQKMEFILGATKTGINIVDSDFNMKYIDPEWGKVYGDPEGMKCYQYFMGRSEICHGCGIPAALKTKQPIITEEKLVKEGNRPIQVTTIPFQNEQGEWLVAEVNVDITEKKKVEKAKEESDKIVSRERRMESVSTLIGGVAHDFNNSLAGIMGYLELALYDCEDNKIKDYLQHSLRSAIGSKDLVQKLMGFSRGSVSKKGDVDVCQSIDELFGFLKNSTNRLIKYECDIPQGEFVNVNLNEFNNALMNLGVNAAQAIEEKIKSLNPTQGYSPYIKVVSEDCKNLETLAKDSGDYVCFSFKDNGIGMSEEVKERAFDPAFSTKPLGTQQGQGYGLAMVYKNITDAGGFIDVKSKEGEGTEFYIGLPKVTKVIEQNKSENVEEIVGGNETLLIIDDEASLRDLMKGVLNKYGYNILVAEDGKKGFDKYQEHNPKLVLLDRSMPELSGENVLCKIKERNPETKVVYVSGHNKDEMQDSLYKADEYLQKPFGVETLVETVRRVLDSE